MLQSEFAGDEVKDEAEVSGGSTIEYDDRGKISTVLPVLGVLVEFRFSGSLLDWRGAI